MGGADRANRVLRWVGIGCLVLASPCLLMGVLGLVGMLADVGPAENRALGVQALQFAVIPAGLGAVLLGVVWWRRRSN